jgi:hypothetical protein
LRKRCLSVIVGHPARFPQAISRRVGHAKPRQIARYPLLTDGPPPVIHLLFARVTDGRRCRGSPTYRHDQKACAGIMAILAAMIAPLTHAGMRTGNERMPWMKLE